MVFATIAALADHDDRAFMLGLYQDYYGLVRHTLGSLVYDPASMEDLINDTFIKLIEKTGLLRTLECRRLAAYVVYTARSVAINFLRRKNVRSKYVFFTEDVEAVASRVETGESVEDLIVSRQEINELWSAILQLPERQKDLLYFKYMLEMDDAAIAEVLLISPASVRQYLTRARRAAKELMNQEVNLHGDQTARQQAAVR